jgi:hypothetical protein
LRFWARNLLILLPFTVLTSLAHAQALPTATQMLRLSVFGGATGMDIGLAGSRTLGATAGLDVGVGRFFGLQPGIELRGTETTQGGVVSSEKEALIGATVGRTFGHIQPYADFLFGRGLLDFGHGGYINSAQGLIYTSTPGNVLSPGAGINLILTEHFSVKLDGQYQRIATPVTATHYIYTTPLTFGVIYNFNFNRHAHFDKRMP